MRKPTFWFPTRSDTNQAVQLQKMARGLKFRIKKKDGLYYLCCGNKGADQLRGYREADLRLCFCICKMLVFLRRGLFFNETFLTVDRTVYSILLFAIADGFLQTFLYHVYAEVRHESVSFLAVAWDRGQI